MKNDKNTVLGILAHVDAGKTTLSEAMLYLSGKLKTLGRVDHRDSFLDTHSLERQRGITIFSKQAILPLGEGSLTLLDTPGHVDFSAEAERTLRVLDCAALVISGTDGVQAHTETLWKLLERYRVPTFLFITKMDLPGPGKEALMGELTARLSEHCVDFGAQGDELLESVALCDEATMEEYLSDGAIGAETIRGLVAGRKLFPCFFGSGLKTEGVQELLDALAQYAPRPEYGPDFAARVYKISRDAQGNRLTWLKVTGGSLKVRSLLRYTDAAGETVEEKISQLRLYSGTKFETAEEIGAGWVCAALGLSATRPGQGLGAEADAEAAVLEPVMSYRLRLDKGTDPMVLLPKLLQLDQEDPQLHVVWNAQAGEISVQLMGKIQAEIFKSLVKDRFDTEIELDAGRILYRETIKNTVEGVGHFEPLRHYAEVHLLLEPLPAGSGLSFDSIVPEDALDRNWQRLILTHLAEKQHQGVLTGAPITDMRITLAAGKAHLKHTEGGDFRQATYRAVRQGLMQAESVLLEPWYSFALEVPAEQIGRAITDVRAMNGAFSSPEEHGEFLRLEGAAPAAKLTNYMEELVAWSHGRGRLSLTPCGYRPCAEQKRIVEEIGYEPERDEDNPADSVFCSHGAGVNIRWNEVPDYMHLESVLKPKHEDSAPQPIQRWRSLSIDERELEAIMEREFGPIRRPEYRARQLNAAVNEVSQLSNRKEYLIVDGYNLIFAWDELKALAAERLDLARERLMDILSGYAGFTGAKLVLVFDGFRTPGNPGSRTEYHNISVAFTRDGETGDAYIERLVNEIGKNYAVRVVTSDNLIRVAALRSGVLRCSSGEFRGEAEWVLTQIEEVLKKTNFNAHKTRMIDGTRRDS
ncbi:MAG: TetM/TetW/TetO/TetS family tetracycline resistance ribosomal protection protein [Oscillospiraceae bacterium]|nr:TetM/TetW/TetO/TetS family tetracycline resistance ribosomal protection protein [Oscillospiraceae bacterium]